MDVPKLTNQDRRSFVKKLSALLGSTAAASVLTAASVSHAFSAAALDLEVAVFKPSQLTLLREISDVILPRTDTPSATDLNCHGFVQSQLAKVHGCEQIGHCAQLLDHILESSLATYNKSFGNLPLQTQIQILSAYETGAEASTEKAMHFQFLKSLIIFGYFTSQQGASEVLKYQAVPGGFKGSIKITSNTPGWGSLAYY